MWAVRRRVVSPFAAAAVVAVGLGVAACGSGAPAALNTSGGASSTRSSSTSHPTTAPSSASSSTTATSTSTSTSTTATSTTTTSTAPGPENLVVSTTDKQLLTAAFVDYTHLPAQDIAGTAPGSVYFAFDPTTDTYWALASFSPTPSASQHTQIALQDGGNMGIFSRRPASAWQMLSTGSVPFCVSQTAFPPGVVAVWGLSDPSGCSSSSVSG